MSEWISDHQLDEMIIELVARTKQQYAIPTTCSGADACRKLSLKLRRAPLAAGTDGLLSGDTIVINEAVTWQPRVEFTIFHEITHYLLEEDGQHYEYFTSALRKDDRAFKAAIERYCDRGAAEFLIPRQRVRAAIQERGFSVELVEHLAVTTGASIVASAIQLASCAPIPCYVLLCVFGLRPRCFPAQRGLYVEYVATPHSTRYPLARFAAIPQDHLCYQAWQDRTSTKGRSFVPFPSGKRMPCGTEANCLHDRRVAAILSLEQMVTAGQLSLAFPES